MALHKTVIIYILFSFFYRAEIWYSSCIKPGQYIHTPTISACLGWHVDIIEKTLTLAIHRVLLVYHITLIVTLF